MRRTLTVLGLGVALALSAGTPASAHVQTHSHVKGKAAAKHSHKAHVHKAKKVKKAKHNRVVLVGDVASTSSAVAVEGAVPTVTLTVVVKGGNGGYRGKTVDVTVAENAVVQRNDVVVTAAEIRTGDKVALGARKGTDGSLTAFRVNASGSEVVLIP